MKLYSVALSPYASRVRVAIYAKGLDVEIVAPPEGGMRSPEYLAVNPIGKVPALVTDAGQVIPESETILEYLADAFPGSGLLPADAGERAQARLLARIGDLYLMAAGGGLFGQINPATRDAAAVEAAFAKVDEALGQLNLFLGEGPYAVGKTLTLADCSLAPALFFMGVFGQVFGKAELVGRHAKLAAYAAHMRADPAVAKVYGEMQAALAARMGAAAGA